MGYSGNSVAVATVIAKTLAEAPSAKAPGRELENNGNILYAVIKNKAPVKPPAIYVLNNFLLPRYSWKIFPIQYNHNILKKMCITSQ